MDSVVLLDALAREGGRPVSAVHVHHGLSANADRWAAFCEGFCASRGIALTVERVAVARDSGTGLEAAAREARYRIYAARNEPFVALAHHLDDQAETVLLQLLRGSGLKGVAGMPGLRRLPDSSVTLWRPLLGLPRETLHEYAKRGKLEWIEDDSNALRVHDRNYFRHEVAPLLDARFPQWRDAVSRFACHAADADAVLADIGEDDGPDARAPDHDVDRVSMVVRHPLTPARRANALRAFLQRHGLPMPSTAVLEDMARQVYDARDDARVRISHGGIDLVRHGGRLYIESRAWSGEPWRVPWHGEQRVELGGDRGHIIFAEEAGAGIDATRVGEGDWHFSPRQGGERIRIGEHRPTRTLKNLVQERGLTLWQRQHFPCLFHGDRLVWMMGIGIEADYACPAGARGLSPRWTMARAGPSVLK